MRNGEWSETNLSVHKRQTLCSETERSPVYEYIKDVVSKKIPSPFNSDPVYRKISVLLKGTKRKARIAFILEFKFLRWNHEKVSMNILSSMFGKPLLTLGPGWTCQYLSIMQVRFALRSGFPIWLMPRFELKILMQVWPSWILWA